MTLRWAASSTKATPTSPWTSHPLWSTANISCLHLSLFSYRSIHLLVNMLPLNPFNHLFPTCTYSTGIPWRSSCSKSGARRCTVLCDGACRPSVANMLFRGYSVHRSGADCITGNKNESWNFVCSQKKLRVNSSWLLWREHSSWCIEHSGLRVCIAADSIRAASHTEFSRSHNFRRAPSALSLLLHGPVFCPLKRLKDSTWYSLEGESTRAKLLNLQPCSPRSIHHQHLDWDAHK